MDQRFVKAAEAMATHLLGDTSRSAARGLWDTHVDQLAAALAAVDDKEATDLAAALAEPHGLTLMDPAEQVKAGERDALQIELDQVRQAAAATVDAAQFTFAVSKGRLALVPRQHIDTLRDLTGDQ